MKWLRTMLLFDQKAVSASRAWYDAHESVRRSIESIEFPAGTGRLILRKKQRLNGNQWARNGVVWLKDSFVNHMVQHEGWSREASVVEPDGAESVEVLLYPSMEVYNEPVTSKFGKFDLLSTTPDGLRIAVEWETGNISSSHRSLNKLAVAIEAGYITAGVNIVPSRALYAHLTDRVGNIHELSRYLELWKGLGDNVHRGLLALIVVEHDELTDTGAYLPTGNDGRAAEGRRKLKSVAPERRRTRGNRKA